MRILALACLCLLTAGPRAAVARPPANAAPSTRSCSDRGPPKVALVVSGGVSLGSYQAGFLYYIYRVPQTTGQ